MVEVPHAFPVDRWPDVQNLGQRNAWLFGAGSIPNRAPEGPAELALAAALSIEHWPVAPLTANRLRRWAEQAGLDSPAIHTACDRGVAVATLARLQRMLTARLGRALSMRGIPYAFLKGAATGLVVYEQPELRGSGDLDIGIPTRWLHEAEVVVREQGFFPAQWNGRTETYETPDLELRRRIEAEHHELGFHVRTQRIEGLPTAVRAAIRRITPFDGVWSIDTDAIRCHVGVDIHHGLWQGQSVDALVESAIEVTWNGTPVRIATLPWLALFLVYKIYWEGVQNYRGGLHQYSDLVRVVPLLDDAGARTLVALLEKSRLTAGAHYVLRRLPTSFGVPLPSPLAALVVREAFAPHSGTPRDHNDRGDMWPKLWGYR
jgi:hypothetical protein